MKIGIPRALLYYYYYPFWKTLFSELGCQLVISDETNAGIVSEGSSVTVSELCVPIKIFNGHVLNLLKKDVDYILLPQFVSMGKEWYCPKFLGLVEIADYSIPGLKEKALPIRITSKDDVIDRFSDWEKLCDVLGVSKSQLRHALKKAAKAFLAFREDCKKGYTILEAYDKVDGKQIPPPHREGEVTIGLLGYVNNVYDNFVSMNAIQKMRDMNVRVVTFDMLDENLLKNKRGSGKQPYWVFARKVYHAAREMLAMPEMDGLIHLTAFCCGPDSVIGKLMELDCEAAGKPFMTLRVDEHTGESHVQTRLEAFIDMLKMSKERKRSFRGKGVEAYI